MCEGRILNEFFALYKPFARRRAHAFSLRSICCYSRLDRRPARSQSDADKAVKSLSAPTQTTVKELSSLVTLPADEWRFHAGDVAHGESTDLDDTSWQTVKKDTHAPNEAVWYRRWIEIPKTLNGYDLTGARVWFQFVAYANGPMPEIIYFNGRRVAMGEDLEPIVLFDQAKPGDKVLVAIKLLHTVDQKYFAGANLRIEFTPSRPNPRNCSKRLQSVSGADPYRSARPPDDSAAIGNRRGCRGPERTAPARNKKRLTHR